MTTKSQASGTGVGHERRDVDVVSLALIATMLLLCALIIHIAIWGLMTVLSHRNKTEQTAPPGVAEQHFPRPRLQSVPHAELAKFDTQQAAELNSYGWIDEKAGVVRIPIERAMQLLLERGLPDVGAGQTPLSLMQARPQQNESKLVNPSAKP